MVAPSGRGPLVYLVAYLGVLSPPTLPLSPHPRLNGLVLSHL